MSEVPERNGSSIARQARDNTPDRTQWLLNHASWDTFAAMAVVRRFAVAGLEKAARRGRRRGGLVIGAIDETGQEKAGEATCGVKRQYLGCAGTVANGINTAHLSYVRKKTGHALIGAHQQIPREHIDDPVRSLVMGLPPDLAFRSKGQLAIDISTDAAADGIWPDFYCGDEVYGTAPSCASTSKPGARRTYCGCRRTSSSPLAAGTKLTCAQAAGSLLTHKRRWEVRSVGNGSKGELVVRLGLPPVRPDRPPPPDPGMIPLTIPKIKRLLNARTARRCPGGSLSHWDAWTRLLSFCDDADLRDADPDTLRYLL